jgi:hypothetical protein
VEIQASETVALLLRRFGGATVEMLNRVLTPYRLRITELSEARGEETKTKGKKGSQSRKAKGRKRFRAEVTGDIWTTFEQGTTGKVVPKDYVEGEAPWREIVKARVLTSTPTHVDGELYFAGPRLETALAEVQVGDYLEIDPFGVTSKVESVLAEAAFFREAERLGFSVIRMPENVAMHIGTQSYYDFRLQKDGKEYWIELKSLWGTDTTKARLIHTVSRDGTGKNKARKDRQIWRTSSCRFRDQDIFAVSMWLRTGRITDFAYALSVPSDKHSKWGLPKVPTYPEHVTQNPPVPDPPSGAWTPDLLEACKRVDEWKGRRKRR